LIAQEEQDRERAEERKKKDAKRKRDERKSESPTMKQRKEANCKKSAAYKRKKRADEKAKEDSYKDRCKTAGCQYVPPVRKEKAADREFRHDQMDEQISLREDAKENERVRKEATRLSAKLDMFCSFLSDREFGPVGSNSRKMFFVHSEWDEDRCKEACRKLSRITGADAYVPPRNDCEASATELRRNGEGHLLMPNHKDFMATQYKIGNRARRRLEMDYFCALDTLLYLAEHFDWTEEDQHQKQDDIMKAAQRKLRYVFKFYLPRPTTSTSFVPQPGEGETSNQRHQRFLAMERMYNPVVLVVRNDP
jgi:hypothetical protein